MNRLSLGIDDSGGRWSIDFLFSIFYHLQLFSILNYLLLYNFFAFVIAASGANSMRSNSRSAVFANSYGRGSKRNCRPAFSLALP
jgi:hypothetical protein